MEVIYEQINHFQENCINKRRYNSKEQAQDAFISFIARSPRKKGRRASPIKHKQIPYRCENCGGWHLTRI